MRYRTLTKNKEFSRIYARGKSYVHPNLVLYVAKNRLGYTRIGLTATKRWAMPCSAPCAAHYARSTFGTPLAKYRRI